MKIRAIIEQRAEQAARTTARRADSGQGQAADSDFWPHLREAVTIRRLSATYSPRFWVMPSNWRRKMSEQSDGAGAQLGIVQPECSDARSPAAKVEPSTD